MELGARIERRIIGLVGFLLGAVLWRAPAMVFIDLNWDEALYRLIGASVLGGEMPYVGIWDRKPVGLFLIHAAAQAMPVDPVLATRLAASLAVGAGAFCLAGIARLLFAPMLFAPVLVGSGRLIGGIAGVLYIVFSVRNGGDGVNSELFFGPLNIAGLWLLLHAVERKGRAGIVLGGVAGALLGAALQVKYNALFEWPAFVAAAALIWPAWRRPIWRDPVTLAAVAGVVVPSAAVLLWYAGAGRWEDWVGANIAANGGVLTGDAQFAVAGVPFLLRQVAPLVVGAALAVPAAMLPGSASSRRGLLVVALWLAGAVLALLALRRFADHMLLQLLAPMALAGAFAVVRLGAALARVGRWRVGLAIGAALLIGAWVGPGLAQPFVVAMEVLMRRHGGAAHWGDPSATVGAALRERLRPGERIFVFGGPILGVYQAAGQRPPTRFAFVPHLWASYAPVDGGREIAAILAQRPAFIVVAQAWQPGQPLAMPEGAAIFAQVHRALAESYVQEGMAGRFVSWGGGAIGPREGIVVFRRADRPVS